MAVYRGEQKCNEKCRVSLAQVSMKEVKMVNTVSAMQHTSKQFLICIIKKVRQHFNVAIITPNGWLYTDKHQLYQSCQQSKKRPKLAGHTKCARQSEHRKQYTPCPEKKVPLNFLL